MTGGAGKNARGALGIHDCRNFGIEKTIGVDRTMWEIFSLLLVIVFIAAAIIAGALLWRGYVDNGGSGATLFRPKNEKRLEVLEQAGMDGRRRLVLIRRDDTEHLIMIGGPVDVVIETGIETNRSTRSSASVVKAPVVHQTPRTFGKAAGEN